VLDLGYNKIDDISTLSELTDLTFLDLSFNYIKDISPLSDLSDLELLSLGYNFNLGNISALSDLTNLNEIYLYWTKVKDIQPLVDNRGLSSDDYVNLVYAPLSSTSRNTYIPELQSKGVRVVYSAPLFWSWAVMTTIALGVILVIFVGALLVSRMKKKPSGS
jgi:Leucine-rich repeat (LRR) protein